MTLFASITLSVILMITGSFIRHGFLDSILMTIGVLNELEVAVSGRP